MPQRNIFKQRGEGIRNPNVTRNIVFGRPLRELFLLFLIRRPLVFGPRKTHFFSPNG